MNQYLRKLLDVCRYLAATRARLLEFAATSVCSSLAVSLYSLRVVEASVLVHAYLVVANTICLGVLNLMILLTLITWFERRTSLSQYLFHLGLTNINAYALQWSRFHLMQMAAVPLAVTATTAHTGMILIPLGGAYAGIGLSALGALIRFTRIVRTTGRAVRPIQPHDLDREVTADAYVQEQIRVEGRHRLVKKRIHEELRNVIVGKDQELTVRFAQPVDAHTIELGIAAAQGGQRGQVSARFDGHEVLRKPLATLHAGWNDFQELADESRLVSAVRLRASDAQPVTYSIHCARPVESPRNVIVIVVDGLRRDVLGVYQSVRARTPAIDRFFGGYTRYEQAHAQGEWTLPSFASIATSLYSSHHHVVNPQYTKAKSLPEHQETCAEALQRHGYFTVAHASHPRVSHLYGHHRGFTRFIYPSNRSQHIEVTQKALEILHTHPREHLYLFLHYLDMRPGMRLNSPFCWKGTARMTERMHDIFEKARTGRPSQEEHYFTAMYANKMAELDFSLGLLFSYLETSPLRDTTAVILTADHGITLPTDEIDGWTRKHLSDELLRVPLLLRCPWRPETHHKVFTGIVESCIDLYPTIVELAGIEARTSAYSRSFLPDRNGHFRGKPYAVTESIFNELYQCRILDAHHEYLHSFRWRNGQQNDEHEELREATSRNPLSTSDPSFRTSVDRFRSITHQLQLFQPGHNPDEYY